MSPANPVPPLLEVPAKNFPEAVDRVTVEGPVMTKELKSRRIWQMLVFSLHTFNEQVPEFTDEAESK